LINDGSTDESEQSALKYNDKRIKYFKQKNLGVSAARNVGLNQMQGSYFCFLDADDLLPPGSIECRMKKFVNDPDLFFCDGNVEVWNYEFKTILKKWQPFYTGSIFKKIVVLDEKYFFGPTWLIKRLSDFDYKLETDMRHCEDIYFYVTIARQGKYDYVDDVVFQYRSNPTSAMSNYIGLAKGYSMYIEKIYTYFGNAISLKEKIILFFRVRKIMFLSFLAKRDYTNAFVFLLSGKTV
jgi:glycosyltransferase involved in cell wall biosynthesis